MSRRSTDLALFAHLTARPEAELDLGQAALLIAEPEYPGLDLPHYLERLDRMGELASSRLAGTESSHQREGGAAVRIARVVRLLFEELGFAGNGTNYYDPRNSFLNEVIDRRIGIPITLAVVLLEVCRRADVEARGVGFPGHFLVRAPGESGPVFVDPFNGRLLATSDLRALHLRLTGEDRDPDPRTLEPVTKVQILLRMLGNLRGIYAAASDRERLIATLERMHALAPSEQTGRQLEQLGGSTRRGPGGGQMN